MLTAEQNQRLTRVGPGTPMGELLRRYWHPIAPSAELSADNPAKEVRILGEDLVLYRDAKGTLGLIEPSCAHRRSAPRGNAKCKATAREAGTRSRSASTDSSTA